MEVKGGPRYVGRGGLKLEAALAAFGIDPTGCVCLDIGASTGGFTDCLLQHGAARVYAIDVGHSQLDWKIRSDPRVVVREKLNARYLTRADIPEEIAVCTIDVSFISLTLILPPAFGVLTPTGVIVPLIKPQFELGKSEVGKGGIVRDPAAHEAAVRKVRDFAHGPAGPEMGGRDRIAHPRRRGEQGIPGMSAPLIGLVAHTGKPGALAMAARLQEEFRRHGVEVRMEEHTAAMIGAGRGREHRGPGARRARSWSRWAAMAPSCKWCTTWGRT